MSTFRPDDNQEFRDPLVLRMVAFLRGIGLEVGAGTIAEPTVLPGVTVEQGRLVIDELRLKYPGDVLHEAGHLAVAPPAQRDALDRNVGNDGAEEMMAIGWSYAAALHLGIDPAIVFHADGYRGGGDYLVRNFLEGHFIGLPMLQWVGMTFDEKRATENGARAYPHMQSWLREQ